MSPEDMVEANRGRLSQKHIGARRRAVDALNEAQAGMEKAQERIAKVHADHADVLQRIRSEKGTAAAEYAKHAAAYEKAREQLQELTPDLHPSARPYELGNPSR